MGRIRSPMLRNSLFAVGLVAGTSAWLSLDAYAQSHGFFINRSPSLPNWAYYFERGKAVKRGEVAFFAPRSEEHTSELQSLMRRSYAVFCLKTNNTHLLQLITSRITLNTVNLNTSYISHQYV